MASKNKQVLVRNTTERTRQFDYSIGNVSLKFNLRTDIKSQLEDFLSLLEAAVVDVREELNKTP